MNWTVRFRFGGIESSLQYLEKMAAKGWKLESWQENTLFFRRCEPQKLRFAMDILPLGRWSADGEAYNEAMRQEYVAIYEEAGWEYIDNQGRKFILCTEREDVPMPQTDPVSYQETVHRENKKKFLLYFVPAFIGMLIVEDVWKHWDTYLTYPEMTILLMACMCLTLTMLVQALRYGIQIVKERRALKVGQVPVVQGSEWMGRLAMMSFLLSVILLVVVQGMIEGFDSMQVWGWSIVFLLIMLATNVLPWILHRILHMSKLKAARTVRHVRMLLLILTYAILWSDIF